MVKHKLDKETKKAIVSARGMIEGVAKADGNEAETRRRVERLFESLMGYDIFKNISREHAVHGVGDTEHCDFAIQLESSSAPIMLVELKRVNIDLQQKHIKQAASYAINMGCEWVMLTNGRDWRLYHISFGQPPQTKLVDHWNLIDDDPSKLAEKFDLICYKNVKKNGLDRLWEKSNVLTPNNVLKALLSEDSISLMRRQLKKMSGVMVSPEDVVGAIRQRLNEAAAAEMDNIKISLPVRKQRRKRAVAKKSGETKETQLEAEEETSIE